MSEKPNHWAVLQELLQGTGTGGNLTTDAQLAAIAITPEAPMAPFPSAPAFA